MTYRPLFEDPIILTVYFLHPLAVIGKASLSDLRQETLIRLTGHCPLGTYVDEFLLRKRIQFAKEVETEDIDVAKSLVAQGIGVTITSCLSIQREKKSEEIAEVDFEGIQELSWEIQCVYSSSGGLSYPGWEMVKLLEENARKLLK